MRIYQEPQALQVTAGGVNTILNFPETVQEKRIVGHSLFDKLVKHEHFGAVNDRVNAMLESLHGRESLKRAAEQNDCGVAALADGHCLNSPQSKVLFNLVCAKKFLNDDDFITHLGKTRQKVTMCGCGMEDL